MADLAVLEEKNNMNTVIDIIEEVKFKKPLLKRNSKTSQDTQF